MGGILIAEPHDSSTLITAFSGVDENGILSYSNDAILATSYADDYMIQGSGFGCEDILLMTAAGGANVLDTLNSSIYLLEFDFHYETNTVGSRLEWTK